MVSAVSYNFQKADHRDILEYLGSIQWNNIFDAHDADEAGGDEGWFGILII